MIGNKKEYWDLVSAVLFYYSLTITYITILTLAEVYIITITLYHKKEFIKIL